jgi:hypothetical protein
MLISKIIITIATICLLCILVAVHQFQPRIGDFSRYEERQGQFVYDGLGRNAHAQLNLNPIYTSVSVFGGNATGVVASIPNGANVVVDVVQVQTLFGRAPLLISAMSVDGRARYLKFTPAECLERSNSKTRAEIVNLIVLWFAICFVAWIPGKGKE